MKAINVEVIDVNKGRVTIVSASEPASLTISGADVEGLRDGYVLAAGSIIVTPAHNYIAFEDGVFMEKPGTVENEDDGGDDIPSAS